MDIRISIDIMKFYPYKEWFFYYKQYKNVKGFNLRILGLHFNIREWNATEKLIKLFKENRTCK